MKYALWGRSNTQKVNFAETRSKNKEAQPGTQIQNLPSWLDNTVVIRLLVRRAFRVFFRLP